MEYCDYALIVLKETRQDRYFGVLKIADLVTSRDLNKKNYPETWGPNYLNEYSRFFLVSRIHPVEIPLADVVTVKGRHRLGTPGIGPHWIGIRLKYVGQRPELEYLKNKDLGMP